MVFSDGVFPLFVSRIGRFVDPFQHCLDTQQQFLRIKRFGNIIVCTNFKTLEHVVLHCFSGQKYDRHFLVAFPDIAGEGEAVFAGHHDIKYTKVVMTFAESLETEHPIRSQGNVVVMHFEIGSENVAKVLVVFYEQDFVVSTCHTFRSVVHVISIVAKGGIAGSFSS